MVLYLLALAGDERVKAVLRMLNDEAETTVLHEAVRLEDKDDVVGVLLSLSDDSRSQSQLARVMGRMVNTQQTPSFPSKPNELHRPELLFAATHGDSHEIERLLLPPHREEDDAARQPAKVVLDVEETIAADIEKPAATAVSPSEAVTRAGDSVLHVVASSGDGDEFLKCAEVIVGMANHLLSACNRKGDTPLHCAARLRNARMVSHLLDLARAGDGSSHDEKVKGILRMENFKGETVLHEAVRLEDEKFIDELLSADPELARVPLTDGASPLYLALSLGHKDIAQLLFKKEDEELSYSGPDGKNALHAAILWEWGEDIIEILLERKKELIKEADRSTGRTPLHYAAALFGETSVTELLLEAYPAAAYVPDSNGSFPIHLAASNGHPRNVWALLLSADLSPAYQSESESSSNGSFAIHVAASHSDAQPDTALLEKSDSDSSKGGINGGHYCAQLRDGKGRTFLHVAVQDESLAVVEYACQEQGMLFASSVMNMQDDDGNTALHLAVEVGDIHIVNALVSIPEVKLNLTNNKGETPRELASSKLPKRPFIRSSNTESRIHWLLHDAAHLAASPRPRENVLPREREIHDNQEDISQSIMDRTQIIGLGSVLITTVTFAAAFAMPGGYRADGTPTLAGHYAFDAFVMANTLAFITSGISIILLMVAGWGPNSGTSIHSLFGSINFLAFSARSLGAAFTFGMYAMLAPVNSNNAFVYCGFAVSTLMLVEAFWTLREVEMVYSDNVALVKRSGVSRPWWGLPRLYLVVLMTLFGEVGIYIIIALSPLYGLI